ncbi:MAG: response regulator transcription factor [Eubacteriales bacterium]|nr:response regulator transcription factor [Eubacteriales bacterium]
MEAIDREFQMTVIPNMSALSFSDLTINSLQCKVFRNEIEIELTNLEFSALLYLAQQPGRVFTKEQIYQHLYPDELTGEINNIIYCLIRSLRKKLEPDPRHPKYIHMVRGVGYKFEPLSEE